MTSADPPGPPGLRIWGYLGGTHRDRLAAWARLHAEYGDLVHARVLGRHYYLLNTPDLARQALVENAAQAVRLPLGQALRQPQPEKVAADREHHRRWRKLLSADFQPARLARYAPVMVAQTREWLARWQPGQEIDLAQEMNGLTLRIVARALFDVDITDSADAFSQAVTLGSEYLAQPGRLPLPTPRNLRLLRAWREIERTVQALIRERRAALNDAARGDLLSTLLAAVDAEDGYRLSDAEAQALILALFIAGHETTAIALTWTLDLLTRHPADEARLRAEIAAVLGERPPEATDLDALPYTQAVIKEALRLYPPAWVLVRQVAGGMPLGGYTAPDDSLLLLSPYLLQRDARYFPDPEQFQPARWLAGPEPPRYAFLPFGAGPHVCLGQFFALMEMALVLVTLLQRLRLEARLPAPPLIEPLITLRPRGAVRMRVV